MIDLKICVLYYLKHQTNVYYHFQWLQKQQSSIRVDRRAYEMAVDKVDCHSNSSSPKPSTETGSCLSTDSNNYLPQVIPSSSMSVARNPNQLHHIQPHLFMATSNSLAQSNASTSHISQPPPHSNNTSNEPCKPAAGTAANDMGPLTAATASN